MPRTLILASTSTHRGNLLRRLGVDFEQVGPNFDERAHDSRFAELGAPAFAELLARGKADSIARERVGAWVLAADQLAVVDEMGPVQLHKPASEGAAVDQLMRLAAREHELITSVVLRSPGGDYRVGFDRHVMRMRAFGRAEAEAYVRIRKPLDSVGAYHIEDEGIALFEAIDGRDFTGIIGLPLLTVAPMLREAGLLPGPSPVVPSTRPHRPG
jgi:septum formation protein